MPKLNPSPRAIKLRSTLERKSTRRHKLRATLDMMKMLWQHGSIEPCGFKAFATFYAQRLAELLYWEGRVDVFVCKDHPEVLRKAYLQRTQYIAQGAALKIALVNSSHETQRLCTYWFA